MSDYKVIFKAVTQTEGGHALTWEPGCPALFTAVQVSRNTSTSAAFLQLKVRNASDKDISSLSIGVEVELSDGAIDRLPLEFLDADIPAGAERVLKPQALPHGNVASCAASIVRASTADREWRSQNAPKPIPARKNLANLPERAFEQRARNLATNRDDDAVRGAVQDNGDWWVCACGQVNIKRDTCCSCKHSKTKLIENEGEAKLLADADKYDRRKHARKKKACAIATGTVALVIATLLMVTQVIIPTQKQTAEDQRIKESKESLANHSVWDKVEFGSYDSNKGGGVKEAITWVIIAKEGNRALLLSDYILDAHEFGDGPWGSSELKRWLEDDFKYAAFSTDECNVLDGPPTILSVDETDEYLSKDSGYRIADATAYAKDQYGVIWERGGASSQTFWWTYRDNEAFLFCRDNGEANKAVYVETRDGLRVKPEGNHEKTSPRWGAPSCIGVRPAVWVQL